MDAKAAYAAYFKDGSLGKLNALTEMQHAFKMGENPKPFTGLLGKVLAEEKDENFRFLAIDACNEAASNAYGKELQPLLRLLAESMSHKIWYIAETSASALFLAVKRGAEMDKETADLVGKNTSHESQNVRINALFALSIHEGGILNGGKRHLYRLVLEEGLGIGYVSSIMDMAKDDWRWGVSELSRIFGTFPPSATGEMLVERLSGLDVQTAMQEPETLQEVILALYHADRYIQLEALQKIRELIRDGLPPDQLTPQLMEALAEAYASIGVNPRAGALFHPCFLDK